MLKDVNATIERTCIINTSSPGVHINYIFPKENLENEENDNLSPSCSRFHNINGHVDNNKHDETTTKINNIDRIMLPNKKMALDNGANSELKQQKPCVNLRTNISATKITMSACHKG